MPPPAARLEPREVSAKRSGKEDGVRVLFELLEGDAVVDGDLENVSTGPV